MTTDRPTSDSSPDLTDEFWGQNAEWTTRPARTVERRRLGSTVGRWWDQLLGGGVDAERAHTKGDGPADDRRQAPTDQHEPASDPADDGLDGWTIEPEPQREPRGGVDPLLARFGALAVIVTLAAPVVLGFTSSGDDAPSAANQSIADVAADGSVIDAAAPTPTSSMQLAQPAPSSAPAETTPGSAVEAEAPTTTESAPVETAAAPTQPVAAALTASEETSEPRPVSTAPAVTTPPCGASYEVVSGDYWIRLADAADVPLAELLAVNGSTVDSVLVPGRSICLPQGARTPAPPTTTTPATTTPAAVPPSSNRVPTTTTAPVATTPPPSRPAAVPTSQAAQVIRDVWPDELEERALEIAWRESNHRSNVNNSCCYGLFQIHWSAHKNWLAALGVTSPTQLFDPVVNANAAYTLYQRAGGFGPWGG